MSKDIRDQQTEACTPAFGLEGNSLLELIETGKITLHAIKVNVVSNSILKLLANQT